MARCRPSSRQSSRRQPELRQKSGLAVTDAVLARSRLARADDVLAQLEPVVADHEGAARVQALDLARRAGRPARARRPRRAGSSAGSTPPGRGQPFLQPARGPVQQVARDALQEPRRGDVPGAFACSEVRSGNRPGSSPSGPTLTVRPSTSQGGMHPRPRPGPGRPYLPDLRTVQDGRQARRTPPGPAVARRPQRVAGGDGQHVHGLQRPRRGASGSSTTARSSRSARSVQ